MCTYFRNLFLLLVTVAFVVGCEVSAPAKLKTGSSSRNVVGPTQANAWSTPALLAEWRSQTDNGPTELSVVPNPGGGFIAGWSQLYKEAHFAQHSVAVGPWDATGPDLTGFKTAFPPRLYTNPKSSAAYATWYSPDHGVGSVYLSRYTPESGWSAPRAVADTVELDNLLVSDNGEAALFWTSYAENGTVELNVRRVDTQGNLALLDTLIFGKPDKQFANLHRNSGVITRTGDIEFYWFEGDPIAPGASNSISPPLWSATLYKTPNNLSRWSEPQKILDGIAAPPGLYIRGMRVFADQQDNRLIVSNWATNSSVGKIFMAQRTAGVWSLVATSGQEPTIDNEMNSVAISPQGIVVLAWVDAVWSQPSPNSPNFEMRVFVAQYDLHAPQDGWSAPVQINNSIPSNPNSVTGGSGYEPKLAIGEDGQIVVAWRGMGEPTLNLYANHYHPGSGWQGDELAVASSTKSDGLQDFKVAVSNTGDATLVWQESQFGVGGYATYQVKAVDHVGVGNGIVNVKAIPADAKKLAIVSGKKIGPAVRLRNPTLQRAVAQLGANRAIATKRQTPVRASSAWDPPQLLDTITTAASPGQFIDGLRVVANDQGAALVSLLFDPDVPKNAFYTGNVLTGGWKKDAPPMASSPLVTLVNDMVVDPSTGTFHLSWSTYCPDFTCTEVFLSQRRNDGKWDSATSLGKSRGGGLNLITNTKSVGATWVFDDGTLAYPKIAYAEYDSLAGWSVPDFFTPVQAKGALSTLGHVNNAGVSAVLAENGTLSIIADSFTSPTNGPAVLAQRDPAKGWRQTNFPSPEFVSDVFLSASGTGDAVQAIWSDGLSSLDRREISYAYSNGTWSALRDITTPKRGDIAFDGPLGLPKDGNTKGQVLVAWNEQVNGNLDAVRQMRVNWYNPVKGWSTPVDIGYPAPANFASLPGKPVHDVISMMRVSVNESGQAAVAWVDSSAIEQTLNIVHLDSTMSSVQQEIVASTDPAQAIFSALDVRVDNLGRAILVWDETSLNATEEIHSIKSATHHNKGSITPQPIVAPQIPPKPISKVPSPSAGWSPIETVFALPENRQWRGFMRPMGMATVAGRPSVAIQVDSFVDPAIPTDAISVRALVSSPTTGVWKEQAPFAAFAPDSLTLVQVVGDDKSGYLYALWVSQQKLYLNAQLSQGAWGTPQLVTGQSSSARLLSNNQGHVLVVSDATTDPGTVTVSEVAIDSAGKLTVKAPKSSPLPNSVLANDPVITNLGGIVALRRKGGLTGTDYVVSQYDYGKGWRPNVSKSLSLAEFAPQTARVAVTSELKIFVFAQSLVTRTLRSALLQTDSAWGPWLDVQASGTGLVALTGTYRVGTDKLGGLHVQWVEELIGPDGEPHSNLMFTSLVPQTQLWLAPTTLAQIRHPTFDETPKLLVANDGAAVAVWRQTIAQFESEAFFVKKFQPGIGWQAAPDIAASFDLFSLTWQAGLTATLSSDKQINLYWISDVWGPGPTDSYSVQTVRGAL